MRLNDEGIQLPPKPKQAKKALIIPETFLAALGKSPAAQMVFERFSDSNKKEYAAWIAGAKTEATRNKRIVQAIEWIAAGKTRDWRYRPKNAL